MKIDGIRYKHGMIQRLSERENLEVLELTEKEIPQEIRRLIEVNDLLSLSGTFGMKEGGDPTEYEKLEITAGGKKTEIEIFNKGMSIFLRETPELKRVFEVCCRLQRMGAEGESGGGENGFKNYHEFSDEALADFLFTEEDRLPRAAVDEFVRRGERMVPRLSEIVSNQFAWTRDLPEWWAVVHAAFIIGAIGRESAVIPLLRALRWADAYDCDWLTEAIPAMLGRIGPGAVPLLKMMAADQTNGQFLRSGAMSALASAAWHHDDIKKDITTFIYSMFTDEQSDIEMRQSAGNVLLDLKCGEYKDALLAFGREERMRKDEDRSYLADFFEDDVERVFREGWRDMENLDRDWLTFYDERQIQDRQRRWREEAAQEEPEEEPAPARPAALKVGRNAPCPCGSKKKYKKCCLGKGIYE